MKEYLISVIVPIYNSEKFLKKCIDSLINQNTDNYEIILINDGSTDDSDIICNEYLSKHNMISYYKKENTGVSNTRNFGILKSKGRYVTFVDSDDYVDSNYIYSAKKLIKKGYELIVFNHAIVNKNKVNNIIFKKNSCDITYPKYINEYFRNYNLSTACKMFYKKQTIIDNNIFFNEDISYGEDMMFSITFYLNSKKSYYLNYIGYFYVMNENSASHNDTILKRKKYCEDNIVLYEYIYNLLNNHNCKYDYNLFIDAILKNLINGIDRIIQSKISGKKRTILEIIDTYKKYLTTYSFTTSKYNIDLKIKLYFIKKRKINSLLIYTKFKGMVKKWLKRK